MALIKCPECGKEISDKAESCPNCGCPVKSENSEIIQKDAIQEEFDNEGNVSMDEAIKIEKPEKKPLSKKVIIGIVVAIVMVIIGTVVYFVTTADSRNYKTGQEFYEKGKYEEAISKFSALGTYKDSKEMVEKCEYALSVDGQFLNALSKGLMERWKYSEEDYIEEFGKDFDVMETSEYIEYIKNCINFELDNIAKFQTQTFSDEELGNKASDYINALNDSMKATDYYRMDLTKYDSLWSKAYSERSVLIRDFVNTYNLSVDEKYQKTLEEFITNASVVDEQEALDKEINDIMSSFVLTPTTDEWGYTTYRLSMENTSQHTFDYFYVDINALDGEGNIIGSGSANQVTNWTPGQKAEVDAWVNVDDVNSIASTTYTSHYQSGDFYK